MMGSLAGLLLLTLRKGRTVFCKDDLEDDDGDLPVGIERELKELVGNKIIRSEESRKYKILVDIYALRKYIQAQRAEAEIEREEWPFHFGELSAYDVKQSVWYFKGTTSAGDEEGSKTTSSSSGGKRRTRRRPGETRDFLLRHFKEDDEDDDENPFECLEEMHRQENKPTAAHCREVILKTLLEDGDEGQRRVQALRVCAEEGEVSEEVIGRRMCLNDLNAWNLSFWIVRNGLAYQGLFDLEYTVAVTPEQIFEYCCEHNERKAAAEKLATVLNNIALKRKDGSERAETIARPPLPQPKVINATQAAEQRLKDLISDEPAMSRSKAIIKVEGCLIAARYVKSQDEIMVYERILQMLNEMSDYVYNNLRKKLVGW